MKKIILIIGALLFLSGCSVDYTIYIDEENNFKEEFSISVVEDENYTKNNLYAQYIEEYPVYIDQEFLYYDPTKKLEEYTYYEKSYYEQYNGYTFNYKSAYTLDDIKRARTINTAFKTIGIGYIKEKDYYYINLDTLMLSKTKNGLDSLNVSIVFDNCTVLSNNADKVENNTYTWYFDGYSDKSINLIYKTNIDNDEDEKDPIKENPSEEESKMMKWMKENVALVTIGSFLILGIVIIIVSFIKKKRL